MQTSVFAAVEAVTVFGCSLAASALLAAGLAGALKPAAASPARTAVSDASKIARLPAIVIIGSRLAATGEGAAAVTNSASNAQTSIYRAYPVDWRCATSE